jgi:hypothetical protein
LVYTLYKHIVSTLDLTLTLFSVNITKAQSTDIDNNREDIQLPSLQVILDSVLNRNAMLKFRNQHIGVKESTLASEVFIGLGILDYKQTQWNLNNFSTNADARQYLFDNLIAFSIVGVYLKIPVFDFL